MRRWSLAAFAAVLALLALLGLAFAGSPATIAEGVHVAGVDVGGMTVREAEGALARRFSALDETPVTFVAGRASWEVTPRQLGIEVNWAAAVDAARREGDGFGPVRGFRRLHTRFFGADVAPPTRVFEPALAFTVSRFAKSIDSPPKDASIVLRGLRPAVLPARTGRSLDRRAAEMLVVRSLAAFSRAPVGLPVRVERPRVTAARLAPVAAQVRTALAAPVRLTFGQTRWRLPRWRIAGLLALPKDGATALAVAGPAADRYFRRLAGAVNERARNARFAIRGERVTIVPARAGQVVDVPGTTKALLAAAL